MSLEKSPDETASTKSSEVFTRELFFNLVNPLLAFIAFLK